MEFDKETLMLLRAELKATEEEDLARGFWDGEDFALTADREEVRWFFWHADDGSGREGGVDLVRRRVLEDPLTEWARDRENQYGPDDRPTDWNFYWMGFLAAVRRLWNDIGYHFEH